MTDTDTAHGDDGAGLAEAVTWMNEQREYYNRQPTTFAAELSLISIIDALAAENAALRAEIDAQWKVQCSHCGHITIGHSPHEFQRIIAEGGMFSKVIDMSDNLPDDGS